MMNIIWFLLNKKGVSKGMKRLDHTPRTLMKHALRYPSPANVKAAMFSTIHLARLYEPDNENRELLVQAFLAEDNYCQLRILFNLYCEAGFYGDKQS